MRPTISAGEVFAAVDVEASLALDSQQDDTLLFKLYRAHEMSAAGKPYVVAQELEFCDDPNVSANPLTPTTADAAGEHSPKSGDNPPPNSTQSKELLLKDGVSAPSRVVCVTILTYFGPRLPNENNQIAITKEEYEAVQQLAQTGHLRGGLTQMRTAPIGRRPLPTGSNAKIYSASSSHEPVSNGSIPHPQQSNGGAVVNTHHMRRPLRTGSHTATQIKALVSKDVALLRTTPCRTCCKVFCWPMCVLINITLSLILPMSLTLGDAVSDQTNAAGLIPVWDSNSSFSNFQAQPADRCYYDSSATVLTASGVGVICNASATPVASLAAVAAVDTSPVYNRTSMVALSGTPSQNQLVTDYAVTYLDYKGLASFTAALNFQLLNFTGAGSTVSNILQVGIQTTYGDEPENTRNTVAFQATYWIFFCFITNAFTAAVTLVDEKREGFREHLRVMGSGDVAYVSSVFLYNLLLTLPTTGLLAVLLRVMWYRGMDVFLIWCVMQLHVTSMIAFAFVLPAVFDSSTWAMTFVIVFELGCAFSSPFISTIASWAQVLLAILCPPVAAWYGILQSFARSTTDMEVSIEGSIGIMIGQSIVFALLGQYLYRIFPGKHGTSMNPLACFMPDHQAPSTTSSANAFGLASGEDQNAHVVLKKLRKVFGSSEKPAVDLDLNVERGEILALLGHNGAGKTTTIDMLTGMCTPTSYDVATVDGLDIGDRMDVIRLNIGVCPQHDVLFPQLSARDHFYLAANLRGVSISQNRLDELLMFLDLPLDRSPVSGFSGGMKRRVSVASALVGDPSIVFLDEPTTGLDEVSRQKLWELLKIERAKGITMIMTTHMMEEAEHLGDRIAIMSYGQLHSIGTAMELKTKHGAGYYLTFSHTDQFNSEGALALIQETCPTSTLQNHTAVETTFFLPGEYQPQYGQLLDSVEANLHVVGAEAYGLAMSTLEDVFVSIAEQTDAELHGTALQKEQQVADAIQQLHQAPQTQSFALASEISMPRKILSDIGTVIVKRMKSQMYMKSEAILQLLLPIALIVVAFVAAYCPPQGRQTDEGFRDLDTDWVQLGIFDQQNSGHSQAAIANITSLLYQEWSSAFPSKELTVYRVTDWSEWNQNTFVVDREMPFRWAASQQHIGLMVDATRATLAASIRIRNQLSPAYEALLSAVIARAIGKSFAQDAIPPLLALPKIASVNKLSFNATVTPNPSPVTDFKCDKLLWGTGAILLLAIVLQNLPVLITINDELKRGVLDTLQANGLTQHGYWIGNFIYDFLFTLIFPIGVLIGVTVARVYQYTDTTGQMVGLFFATMFYCIDTLLYTYTFLVVSPRSSLGAHIAFVLGFLAVSYLVPFIIILPMRLTNLKLEHPGYPMLESLTPTYAWYTAFNYKRDYKRSRDESGGVPLAMLAVHSVFPVLFMTVKLIRGQFENRYRPTNEGVPMELFVDHDVLTEQQTLDAECNEKGRPDAIVAANHLWKKYADGSVAVKGVTFSVRPGECFGLLGSNGAGKTTTMRMMQMEVDPSGGNVTFGHLPPEYSSGPDALRQRVRQGVCQQHDALTPQLTGEEHMHLYLRVRLGNLYKYSDWEQYVLSLFGVINLPLNRMVGQYSGGMKRKLASAMALFTGAEVIYLDEPSTGLDPFARRLLWRTITSSLNPNNAVLLTTHSMEEADAVCGRISIVTEGLMRCIGSSQHLKQRFGSGYLATLLLSPSSNAQDIDREMKVHFGDECRLGHAANNLRQYPLGNISSPAAAYRTLEAASANWDLEQFAISQSTLQNVFVAFAQNLHKS